MFKNKFFESWTWIYCFCKHSTLVSRRLWSETVDDKRICTIWLHNCIGYSHCRQKVSTIMHPNIQQYFRDYSSVSDRNHTHKLNLPSLNIEANEADWWHELGLTAVNHVLQPPKPATKTAADAQTEKLVRDKFKKISGDDREVDAYELQELLNSEFMKGTRSLLISRLLYFAACTWTVSSVALNNWNAQWIPDAWLMHAQDTRRLNISCCCLTGYFFQRTMRSLKRIVRSSVCLSGTGVHCDHTVHVSADLSLWLDSPMFWTPGCQSMSAYFQPFFQFTWKRGRVWMCKLKK